MGSKHKGKRKDIRPRFKVGRMSKYLLLVLAVLKIISVIFDLLDR